jgi:microcin C transport system substrate-binding protein
MTSSSTSPDFVRRLLAVTASSLILFLTTGCGPKAPPESGATSTNAAATAGPDMEADLARTVAAQSSFYQTRPLSDIPASLTWQDGSDLPEFADPAARKGGTFRYYMQDFPRTLRTIGPDATGGIRPYLLDHVAVYILHAHPNVAGRMYPGLAREWAVDADNRTVYYRLNADARWSDGRPVTTADVVFTFYMMRSPDLGEPWYNNFYSKRYERLTVYDNLTFSLTAPERKPSLDVDISQFALYARHAFKDFGPGWLERYQWRTLPTTGAYTLLDRDVEKGRSVTLTRVQDWWAKDKRFFRGRFNPDKYRLEVIRDPDKAVEAFARGDLDMFPLSLPKFWYETIPDDHPAVKSGAIVKAKFFNRIPRPDWGLWINSHKPILNQTEVRLGIQHAANFDLVCQQFFRGDAVRLETRSDGYPFRAHPTLTYRRFDPDLARTHFAKAGFTQQGPDGVLTTAKGERLSFTLTTSRPDLRDLLPILKQEALKAGLELRLEVLDQTTGWKKVQEKNHEITLVALARSVEPYPRYWEIYHGSNAYEDAYLDAAGKPVAKTFEGTPNPAPSKVRVQTNNMTMTFVPELDRLIEAYDKAETMDEIRRIAAQIEQIIYDHASWVNGWTMPFYRVGYARHIRWPAGFNVAQSRTAEEFFLSWIDEDARRESEEARRSGRTFPQQVLTFDQFAR